MYLALSLGNFKGEKPFIYAKIPNDMINNDATGLNSDALAKYNSLDNLISNPDIKDENGKYVINDYFVFKSDSQLGTFYSGNQEVISLVTGNKYNENGYTGMYAESMSNLNSLITNKLENKLKNKTLSLQALAQKAIEKEFDIKDTKEIEYKPEYLDSTVLTQLKESSTPYLTLPYDSLKKVGKKYYSVIKDSSQAGYVIFDFAYENKDNLGAFYSIETNATTKQNGLLLYKVDGYALESIKNKYGINVSNGTENLGLPISNPPMQLENSKKQSVMIQSHINKKLNKDFPSPGLGYPISFKYYDNTDKTNGVFDFYFNDVMKVYFVKASQLPGSTGVTEYIDLNSGYVYDTTGYPRIKSVNLVKNADAKSNGYIIVHSILKRLYLIQSDGAGTYEEYTQSDFPLTASGGPMFPQQTSDKKGYVYNMVNTKDQSKTIMLQIPKDNSGKYSTFNITFTTAKITNKNNYQEAKSTNECLMLDYCKTSTNNNNGSYVLKDNAYIYVLANPKNKHSINTILFNGKVYKGNVSLGKKEQRFTSKAKGKAADTVLVSVEQNDIGSNTSIKNLPYISITTTSNNTPKTLYYSYDAQVLDTDTLEYFKSYIWKLNTTISSMGSNILVPSINTEPAILVEIKVVTTPSGQGGSIFDGKNKINSTTGIYFENKLNQYVYQLNSDDSTKYLGSTDYEDSYVNLNNGILYDNTGYPIGYSLSLDQMHNLLYNLKIEGIQTTIAKTDSKGNSVMENVLPYLVARGSNVVEKTPSTKTTDKKNASSTAVQKNTSTDNNSDKK